MKNYRFYGLKLVEKDIFPAVQLFIGITIGSWIYQYGRYRYKNRGGRWDIRG